MRKKIITVFLAVVVSLMSLTSCLGEYDSSSTPSSDFTIELSDSDVVLNVGQKMTILAECSQKSVVLVWKSSDETIVGVYGDGLIVALKKGDAVITVSDENEKVSASLNVCVRQQVGGVYLDKTVRRVGLDKSILLVASVSPSNADNKNVTWKSSDTEIATVDENGVVTGINIGKVIITVETEDGKRSDFVEIEVVENNVVYICNDYLRDYLYADRAESYAIRKSYSDTTWKQGKYYDYQALNVFWTADGSAEYTVSVADNDSFENAFVTKTTDAKINEGICVPGKVYFVKVEGDNGVIKRDRFYVADEPIRILNVDGVKNVRDLGGWVTSSGKYVKYGMIYRGAEFETLEGSTKSKSTATAKGKDVLKNYLGIKTEIDMRMSNEIPAGKANSVGFENYIWKPLYPYCWIIPENDTDKLYNGATYQKSSATYLRDIFAYFADETKYPIYFHCIQGADRTGTVAFLLNGLLGVSFEDLVRDFELTSFSYIGARSCTVDSTDLTKSTDPSLYTKSQISSSSALYQTYWQLMTYYGDGTGDLSAAISNYLTTVCKVPASDIETIKELLLYNK